MSDDYSVTMQLSGNELLCINSLLNGVKVNKVRKKVPQEVLDVLSELKNRFSIEITNYYEFLNY